MKIFLMPPNSLILFDLVERFGHEPLSLMGALRERVTSNEIEAPPLNVTVDDVKMGLKYAGIEIPSGIRGRLAIYGPLIDEAEAAIIHGGRPLQLRLRGVPADQRAGEAPGPQAEGADTRPWSIRRTRRRPRTWS